MKTWIVGLAQVGESVTCMFCVALALAFALSGARGAFVALTRVDGTTTTHALYDSEQVGPFMHVRTTTTPTSTDIFLVQVRQNSTTLPRAVPKTNAVVGRVVETREIIVGPSGCDNANPDLAVEHSACVRNQIEATSNRELMRSLWFLPYRGRNNDECISKGGDMYSCLGPPLVLRDNADPFSFELVSDLDLLTARGVSVESCSGLYCAIPTVTRVDMVMPRLLIDTTCTAPAVDPARTFSAPYVAFHYDAYSQMVTDVWIAFQRDDGVLPQMRLLLKRTAPDADDFRLVLASAVSDTFASWFTSDRVFNDSSQSWARRLPLGEALQMNNASAGPGACTMTLTLQSRPRELRDPELVTDLNYAKSRRDPVFYQDMSCNYHLGTLDENLQLKYPYCPEGSTCGGDAQYVTPEFPFLPLRVTPNPRYQVYSDNCDHVYPFDTFNGFGFTGNDGPLYDRMVPQRHRCYMPLLLPQPILDSAVVDERERQCFMLGGECSGRSCDVCARRMTYAPCKTGWTDFDAFCYYGADEATDARLSVVGAEAVAACASLDGAEPAPALNAYADAWMTRFVLWRRSPGVVYRLPIATSSTACRCFQMVVNDPDDPNDDDVDVRNCNCHDKAFPVCRYAMKLFEPVDRYIMHSPATIRLLRDGQQGLPWRGEQALCRCYDGWEGTHCTNPTCPTPILQNANNLDEALNNPTTKFFTKCYANGRGACRDGAPRSCFCARGFAPPSTLLPSPADAFVNLPCACPAHTNPDATLFRINNQTFFVDTLIYGTQNIVPCGGITRGSCVVDDFTNTGTCTCETRLDTNPDALQVVEPALGGPSCACRVAKVPPDGYVLNFPNIVQQVCNGARGVCCPANDERCFDERTTAPLTECQCVNGYTGTSCTCIAPFDVVPAALQATTLDAKTYVQFDVDGRRVQRVFVADKQRTFSLTDLLQGCTPTSVILRPFSLTDPVEPVIACTPDPDEQGWWNCANTDTHVRFIVVNTLEQAPYCLVRAFETYFPPCGEHTNPFAGRFFANEIKRRFQYESEPQPLEYAPHGCTDSECMCEPDYSGRGCRAGVSAVRPDVLDAGFVRIVCGESTQPPRGKYDPTSGNCACEALTVRDTTGEAGRTKGVFQGDACACAQIFVAERNQLMTCAGHGFCVAPRFPYGTCDFDLDDFIADPLYTPFVRFRPQVVGEFTYEFLLRNTTAGDARSVVTLDVNGSASSWFMGSFQRVYIRGLQGDTIAHCGSTFRTPLNATFVASNPVGLPQRALANVTVWRLVNHPDCVANSTVCLVTQESFEFACDPAVLSGLPLACSTQNWCLRAWVQAGQIDPAHFSFVIPSDEWNTYAQVCIASASWFPLLEPQFDVELNTTTLQPVSLTNYEGTTVLLDLACVHMQSVQRDSSLQGRRRYGGLDCNNAVHRTIDKALWLVKGQEYEAQCIDLPIGPYTNVLGQFYGLFWNQVQDLRFDNLRDPEDWTPEHYRFVASLLNNERWFNRTTNESVYLMTEHLVDLYIMSWVEGPLADTFLFNGSLVTQPDGIIADIFETLGAYTAFDFVRERASKLQDYPGGSFDTAFSSAAFTDAWYASITDFGLTGLPHAQYTFPWLVSAREFFQFRRPGLTQTMPGFNIRTADRFILRMPFDADVIQYYTDDGRPCLTSYNVKQNQSFEFTCSDMFDDELLDNRLPFSMDGLSPNSSLSKALDNIAAVFNNTNFDDLSIEDKFVYFIMWITALKFDGPKIHWIPADYWGVVPSLNSSFNISINLTYEYAVAGPHLMFGRWPIPILSEQVSVYLQQKTYEQYWADLVDSIVVNHTWPTNGVLRSTYLAKSAELFSRPINVSLEQDQQFLRDVFHTHLAPRQCTADVDCKAQSRKGKTTCVFPADVLAKPWRNGDPALSEQFNVGDEGGCECFDSFGQGFWEAQLFCHFCRDGYGPRSLAEWSTVQQFQDSVFRRTGLSQNVLYDFANPADLDDLNASFVCRFPFDASTDGLMCGGHGLVNVSTAATQRTLYAPAGPRCDTLFVDAQGPFLLQPGFAHPNVLRYEGNGTQLLVLNNAEVWVGGSFIGAVQDPRCETMERAQGCLYGSATVRCEVPFPLYRADPGVRVTGAGLLAYI